MVNTVFATITEDDLVRVREELPEIGQLEEEDAQRKVALVWASFLRESGKAKIADADFFPGLKSNNNLAQHTRHVVKNTMLLAETLKEFWGIEYDHDDLLAAALLHDVSKIVENGPNGKKTELGQTFLHGQLGAVRAMEAGLSPKVVYMINMHPFTPPHVHMKPKYMELIVLNWADLAAADPVFFLAGLPTHFEFEKRFFRLD